jgi:hypothetical protein
VVLITPRLLDEEFQAFNEQSIKQYEDAENELIFESDIVEEHIEEFFGTPEVSSPVTETNTDSLQLTTESSEVGNTPPSTVEPQEIPSALTETDTDELQLGAEQSELKNKPPSNIKSPKIPSPATETTAAVLQLAAEQSEVENASPASIEPIDLGALPERRTFSVSTEEPAEPLQSPLAEQSAAKARPETEKFEANTGPNEINKTISRPTAARGLFAINLESALDPIDLNSIAESLAAPDQQLYTTEVEVDGSTWYRLRLGFFATQTEGDRIMAALKDQYPYAWVVRVAPREHAIADENTVFQTNELTAEVVN